MDVPVMSNLGGGTCHLSGKDLKERQRSDTRFVPFAVIRHFYTARDLCGWP